MLSSSPARLRTVRQLEVADCGAACLAAVLRAYGDHVPLAALRDLTQTGRDGVSLLGVATAARGRGYTATGRRVTPDDLAHLPPGAVLHWRGNHFVVLVGVSARGVRVLDPAIGGRLVPWDQVRQDLTGAALVIAPTGDVVPVEHPRGTRLRAFRPYLVGTAPAVRRAVLWAVAAQSLAVAYPLFLRRVVGDASAHRSATGVLLLLAVASAGAYALTAAARLGALLALQRLVDVSLSAGLLRHVVSLPFSFLDRRSSGDLALRLRSTVVVRQILTAAALSGLLDGALVLLYLALVAAVDPAFAALALTVVVAQIALVALSWRPLRDAAAHALEAQTRSQTELLEIVEGLEVLKTTGAALRSAQAWESLLTAEVAAQTRSARLSGLVDTGLGTLRFATPLLLLVVGLARVDSGDLALGPMLALAALATAVTVPTGELLGTACSLSTVAGYVDRLEDLLVARPERTGGRALRSRSSLAVELRGVGFSYSSLLPPALHDVTFSIEPGEHVVVVGGSGSGKTTLAMLVAGLHEPSEGALLLDAVDVRDLDPEQARSRIGVVTQTTGLFSRSLHDNIAFGREGVGERQVVAAARAAAVHEDIAALPSGYDTRLGSGGTGLSGGQRQRVALARALAGKPGLLVLDEATSALDVETERAVLDALDDLRCTRLVIAHRMTTVRRAHRIVVLDAGRVVAVGSFASLQRRSPEFRALLGR